MSGRARVDRWKKGMAVAELGGAGATAIFVFVYYLPFGWLGAGLAASGAAVLVFEVLAVIEWLMLGRPSN